MSDWRRLHPAAAVTSAVRAFRDLLLPAVITVVVSGRLPSSPGAVVGPSLVGGALLVIVASVAGYVGWTNTTYSVGEEGVRLRRGVVETRETWIPRERVEGVDTVAGPVGRLFGVVEARVQSAAAGEAAEVVLAALAPAAVDELRRSLGLATGGAAPVGERASARPARRLGRPMLVAAAATSGQFGVLAPLGAAALQVLDDLPWGRLVGADARDASGWSASRSDALRLALVLILLAWLIAMAGTVAAFAGFVVSRDGDRLRVRRGLLARREAAIPVPRVQAVRIVEGVLRQPFGLAQLRVETSGYAGEPAAAQTLFPLLPRRAIPAFLADLLPELAGPVDALVPPPRRAVLRYALLPALPFLALALALAPAAGPAGAAAAAAGAGVGLAGLLRFRAAAWGVDGGRLVARYRRLARTTVVAPLANLDERSVTHGPLARRLRLATVGVALASRTRVRVRHVERDVAEDLLSAAVGAAPAAVQAPPDAPMPYPVGMDQTAVRARLEDERASIIRERDRLEGELQEPFDESSGDSGRDMGDVATETHDREVGEGLGEATGHILTRIDHALDRLDAGTYGTCERCGKEIPAARLDALPYATKCIECEELEERERG